MLEQSVPYVVLNGYDPGCTQYDTIYHMGQFPRKLPLTVKMLVKMHRV